MNKRQAGAGEDVGFSQLNVCVALPSALHLHSGGEDIFGRLCGARIVRIGAPQTGDFEGGGLVLDYVLPDSGIEHRLIFEFNELGMWKRYDSARDSSACTYDHALTSDQIRGEWERSR